MAGSLLRGELAGSGRKGQIRQNSRYGHDLGQSISDPYLCGENGDTQRKSQKPANCPRSQLP